MHMRMTSALCDCICLLVAALRSPDGWHRLGLRGDELLKRRKRGSTELLRDTTETGIRHWGTTRTLRGTSGPERQPRKAGGRTRRGRHSPCRLRFWVRNNQHGYRQCACCRLKHLCGRSVVRGLRCRTAPEETRSLRPTPAAAQPPRTSRLARSKRAHQLCPAAEEPRGSESRKLAWPRMKGGRALCLA